MAIKFEEISKKFEEISKKTKKEPLNKTELYFISLMEEYIDTQIKEKFDRYKQVPIELGFPQFRYFCKEVYPTNDRKIFESIGETRRRKMQKNLEKRYKKVGWNIEIKIDDGLDGPNMSGPDYWILKEKKSKYK